MMLYESDGLPTMGEEAETELMNLMENTMIENIDQPDNNQPPKHRVNPQTGSQEGMTWTTRLRIEAEELNTRGANLSAFLKTPEYKALPPRERMLLEAQLGAMSQYFGILQERVKRIDEPDWAKSYDEEFAKQTAETAAEVQAAAEKAANILGEGDATLQ